MHFVAWLDPVLGISVILSFHRQLCDRFIVCGCLVSSLIWEKLKTDKPFPSPFLQFVSNRESFDQQLEAYVQTSYVQEK